MLVAMYRLSVGIIHDLVFGFLNPLEHEVFQSLFGEIMALLIAMEFNHTIHLVAMRKQNWLMRERDDRFRDSESD